MMRMDIIKKFIIKKGQPDWKVWSKVNSFLCDVMNEKRRRRFQERIIKKDIRIELKVSDKKPKTPK